MIPAREKAPSLTECGDEVPVGLDHFAAMCGLSEAEYSKRMFSLLERGELPKLLKARSAAELLEWALEEEGPFVVAFRLSLNRLRDVGLFCVCSIGANGAMAVRHALPGFMDNPPKESAGLPGFEVGFCDMETWI